MEIFQFFLGSHQSISFAEIRALKFFRKVGSLISADNTKLSNVSNNSSDAQGVPVTVSKYAKNFDSTWFDRKVKDSVFVLSNYKKNQVVSRFNRMGGSQKVAKVIDVVLYTAEEFTIVSKLIIDKLVDLLLRFSDQNVNLKFVKINFYGNVENLDSAVLNRLVKEQVKKHDVKLKFVGQIKKPVGNSATSAKVLKRGGVEINVTIDNASLSVVFSETIAVQNYKLFEILEYQRPERDMKIGMMPIKLAFIMLNLAKLKKDMGFWDPMVGLGTLIMAGQLFNVYAYGSDIDKNALRKAEANMLWFIRTGLVQQPRYRLFRFDVTKEMRSNKILRDIIRYGRFDAIVTEGYLGDARYKPFNNKKHAVTAIRKLENLYVKLLRNTSSGILPGKMIVFTTPMYKYWDKEKKQYAWYQLEVPINKHRYRVVSFDTGPLVWENRRSNVARKINIVEKIK